MSVRLVEGLSEPVATGPASLPCEPPGGHAALGSELLWVRGSVGGHPRPTAPHPGSEDMRASQSSSYLSLLAFIRGACKIPGRCLCSLALTLGGFVGSDKIGDGGRAK